MPDNGDYVLSGYKAGSIEFGSVGQKYGAKTHTLTIDQMPSHNHSASTTPQVWSESTGSNNWEFNYGAAAKIPMQRWANLTTSIGYSGNGIAHNNVQPSATALLVIKF